ncbi:MAG: ABC transporter permease [Gemmatirosa sp.]|nr:ABC transporter permease [Gemmatirosa sp.]
MPRIPGLRRVFRLAARRAPVADDVDAELAFHFAQTVDDLVARGLTEDDAHAEARRRFGDVEATRRRLRHIDEAHHRARRVAEWIGSVAQDARMAARSLRRTPGFTAVVVLTLALGVGANAMMFGVVDRLLLRAPSHLRDATRTGRVYFGRDAASVDAWRDEISYPAFRDVRDATAGALDVALTTTYTAPVGEGASARLGQIGLASADFWRLFDLRPALGRVFVDAEDRPPNGTRVAVLGYDYWRELGADSTVLGRLLYVGDQRYAVVGVAPPGFTGLGLQPADVWIPVTAGAADALGATELSSYDRTWFRLVARRHPGVDATQADARLTAALRASETKRGASATDVARARAALYPTIGERGPRPSDNVRVTLWATGVALVVLIVACANVVNLLLVRALQRERETAMRVALGVSGGRLVRQLVVEAALLAALGATAALLLAWLGRQVVARVLVPDVSFGRATGNAWHDASVDVRTIAVTAAIALGGALLASLAPALRAWRPDVLGRLRGSGGARDAGVGARQGRLRGALVVVQAALSVVLLVGAGLFVRSLHNARATTLGVDAPRVVYAWVELRGASLDAGGRAAMYAGLAERARAMPMVEQVGTALAFHVGTTARRVRVPGRDSIVAGEHGVRDNVVGGDYFRAMGTRVVRGRAFDRHDPARDASSLVVSERLARLLWPGEDPLGRCVVVGASPLCRTVVGVVEDVRAADPHDPLEASLYRPAAPSEGSGVGALVVRTRGSARDQATALRRWLTPLLPPSAYLAVRPLAEEVDPALRPWQLGATLFSAFGALGLLVAALGLYGVLAYDVAQRRHDFGVRLALGALRGDVLRLVLRRGLGVAGLGLALGVGLAVAVGPSASALLLGVSPRDPLTLGVVMLVLGAVAVAASAIPGWRAARVDPVAVLRAD